MRARWAGFAWLTLGCAAVAAAALGETPRTATRYVRFPSPAMTAYPAGFNYTSAHADLAVDSAGNAHIIKACQANHIGNVEYRRWDRATRNWAGPVLSFGSGGQDWDAQYAYIAVDDADRVHVLYQHRVEDPPWSGTPPFQWYHAWCTNASGSNPLALTNWVGPSVLTLAVGGDAGSMINVGSNVLLLARGSMDASGDGLKDIRMDHATWDGSSWTWSLVGCVITNTGHLGDLYGGIHSPRLTWDRGAGVLHLCFYDASVFSRGIAFSESGSPANPAPGTWSAPTRVVDPSQPNYLETEGGTGRPGSGMIVTLVWASDNRDALNYEANFARVRHPVTGWGAWTAAFPGDTRRMPTPYNSSYANCFIRDGAGGLFASYDNVYISHWDPISGTWADVFAGLPGGADAPIGKIAAYVAGYERESFLYYYRRSSQTLYVGSYFLVAPPGTLSVIR